MREGGKCQGNEFGLLYLAGGVQMQDSEGLGVRMKGVGEVGKSFGVIWLVSRERCLMRVTGGLRVPSGTSTGPAGWQS